MVFPSRRGASITEAKPDLKALSGAIIKVLTEESGFLENNGLRNPEYHLLDQEP